MNRIASLFQNKTEKVLSIYFTAGYPEPNDTLPILQALQAEGVDMVELGIPYSDPVADGEAIQQSGSMAIEKGFSLDKLFADLQGLRKTFHIPLVIMTYYNPLLQYGMTRFLEQCASIGIDGLICPDLPPKYYLQLYKTQFEQAGVSFIAMATQGTTNERFRLIDSISEGFVYVVGKQGVTGQKGQFSDEQLATFKRFKDLNPKNPLVIGFGVHNNQTIRQANTFGDGAIIGSAFIRAISEPGTISSKVHNFISTLKTEAV